MAEEDGVYELEDLENQLRTLLSRYSGNDLRVDIKPFCSDFCKVVEEFATRWQVPLPKLRILKIALCYFAQASPAFTLNCDIVQKTISSLALSIFELLLFFDQKDFHQEPLQQFAVAFQECSLALGWHQNVHLLQLEHSIRDGGPWACPILQAILNESSLPENEVVGLISSELPVFFELRVRYLLSCERVSEAMALAKCCAWHPTAGQHLFFLQVYLSWLLKTSQHDILHKEVAGLNGKDAVHLICSLEYEEQDELLLSLSRVFLSQQLCRGDMPCLCDLVLIWSQLHHRLKTPQKVLFEEIRLLMQSATNVNSIFPFIRAILQKTDADGIQFCVELCANGLRSCPSSDVITKSLIYKTIASLLPNDLEVCRACALLVFFLECTIEAYKTTYLLYMHPDQDYYVDLSPIRNHIRFEILQVLKKDLYFDPELWNLIALRTNCLKLLSKKVVSSALEELMEDKWILNYCTKETAPPSSNLACQNGSRGARPTQKRYCKGDRLKEDLANPSKRLRLGPGKTLFNVDHTVKRKKNQTSRTGKGRTSEPLRRSFWQLDRLKDSRGYEDRRITRLSEKNPPKRRIRTPKWLLEDSGTLEKKNSTAKIKKHRLKIQKHLQESTEIRPEAIQIRNDAKHKPCMDSASLVSESNGKPQKGPSLDSVSPASPPQVILELSLPDNELFGMFSEDTCNRQRGIPQVLFYKPTMKHPTTPEPVKAVHRREVILRTRDLPMFVQQLHCYTRWLKGKGSGTSVQGSVSKITRSSVQGMPSKGPKKNRSGDTAPEDKDAFVSSPPTADEAKECSLFQKAQTVQAGFQRSSPGREHPKSRGPGELQSESKDFDNALQGISKGHVLQTNTIKHRVESAAQSAAETQCAAAPVLEKSRHGQTKEACESAVEMQVTFASQTPTAGEFLEATVLDKVSQIPSPADVSALGKPVVEESSRIKNAAGATSMTTPSQHSVRMDKQQLQPSQIDLGCPESVTNVHNSGSSSLAQQTASTNYAKAEGKGFSATSPGSDGTNDVSDFTVMVSEQAPPDVSTDLRDESRPNALQKSTTTSSCPVSEQKMSAIDDDDDDDDAQVKNKDFDDFVGESTMNMEPVESEESKLEFCCTFCKKVFNGSRVVAHAMFHFRKDECMFCGTTFKDDLLAMMHLSDHIEKLKKSKESTANKVKEKQPCDAKDDSTPNSSVKANDADLCTGHHRRGRPRKAAISPKAVNLRESGPCGSRKLRSTVEQENEQNNPDMRTPGHKMNGNIAKNAVLERLKMVILNSKAKQPRVQKINPKGNGGRKLQKSQSSSQRNAAEIPKTTSKHRSRVVQEQNQDPERKVVCPVEGCFWALDLSKNRVALLYHALEDHYGDIRPLKLAFGISNSKCSICMRVLWSFEHFRHHVERHRLTPRHPCLHQGCTARFKTGIEMRRHTRKHSPLQAVCCLPGCSKLFICLWALNLHEREHYSSKSTKADRNSSKQTQEKSKMGQQDSGTRDGPAVDETPRQPRGDATNESSTEKQKTKASLCKRDFLKNVGNKERSEQPAGPQLRLRQEAKVYVRSQRYRTLLKKAFLSSFLKRKIKARHKFRRQLRVSEITKRRGHPPKLKDAAKTLENQTTQASNNDPEPKNSVNQKFRKNHIKQNGGRRCKSAPGEKKCQSSSSRFSTAKGQTDVKYAQLTLVAAQMAKEGQAKDEEEEAEYQDTSEKSSKKNRQNVAALRKKTKQKCSRVSRQQTEQKDGSKPSLNTAKLSPGDQCVGAKTDEKDGTKQEAFDLPVSSLDEMIRPSSATDETRKEESHLGNANSCVKASDSDKVDTLHKVTDDGLTKPATDKDDGAQETVSERSRAEGAEPSPQVAQSGARSRSYSVKMNGQAAASSSSSVCIETLAEYGKKPYMRPPPTVYLDERYTTMPKRRKEMIFSHSSERVSVQEVAAPLQRQRCANCFATFSSTDELQAHILQQKCSNLFGFDSDDEGNS